MTSMVARRNVLCWTISVDAFFEAARRRAEEFCQAVAGRLDVGASEAPAQLTRGEAISMAKDILRADTEGENQRDSAEG